MSDVVRGRARSCEKVRERFPEYVLKFSSEDPRNPVNIASEEEARVIEYFRVNPNEKEWAGPITIAGREYRGHFAARRMVDPCLRCHGDPADAPASLVERYGDKSQLPPQPGRRRRPRLGRDPGLRGRGGLGA